MLESNQRPLRCERSALTAALIAQSLHHMKKPKPQSFGFPWATLGSNQRPLPCQGSALPLRQPPNKRTEPRGGYGSRTRLYGFAGRCLTAWLTHRKGLLNSSDLRADNGTRTRGLDLGKVARYQLSYGRICDPNLSRKLSSGAQEVTIQAMATNARTNPESPVPISHKGCK